MSDVNVLIAVGAIIAIVVLAIVIDSALYYNKIHAGIRVSTVSLGCLTRDEGRRRTEQLRRRSSRHSH
jgi:hypothetical protein